jgi:hypothetical protein
MKDLLQKVTLAVVSGFSFGLAIKLAERWAR